MNIFEISRYSFRSFSLRFSFFISAKFQSDVSFGKLSWIKPDKEYSDAVWVEKKKKKKKRGNVNSAMMNINEVGINIASLKLWNYSLSELRVNCP